MLTNNRELKKILRDAEGNGWTFEKRTRHIFGKHPNGQTATIAVSPSDRRAYQNILHYLKLRPR